MIIDVDDEDRVLIKFKLLFVTFSEQDNKIKFPDAFLSATGKPSFRSKSKW